MKQKQKKILCTLGPASMNDRVIARLTDLGVDLFRINLSHTKFKDLADIIDFIQARTDVPICLDTEGAQVRTGDFSSDAIFLKEHGFSKILRAEALGTAEAFNFYPLDTVDKLEVGDIISIDFNSVLVEVIRKNKEGVLVKVLIGGKIGKNKAVSVDREIALPALTDKDKQSLALGMEKGIRHVALSFANKPEDVKEIMSYVKKDTYIISKIESIQGIKNLGGIAGLSNGILLDRGDLSRQIAIEQIPRAQKEIIRRVQRADAEIFVATNLLESMITVPAPTRAEVNDVFNTLVDGADGLVLAAETAIGSFPVECAIMVSKIIKQFLDFRHGANSFCEDLNKEDSWFLIEPHGGILVDRHEKNPDYERINKYNKIVVEEKDIINLEQIALGAFSPLTGFMTKKEMDSVIDNYKLPSGIVWPLPVVLQVSKEVSGRLNVGQKVALCLKGDDAVYGILDIADIYSYNLERLTKGVFGTNSTDHPGVRDILASSNHFLGGTITLIKRKASENKHFEITPKQVRKIFEHKGWTQIVGFHTRNIAHRAHEYIQKEAMEKSHCDGIFIHPLAGPKKKGDYSSEIILKSYEMIIEKYYPAQRVLLTAWQNYPRYAGPREAVFTALCRKNYGCTHFVVGRDHSGVKNYYEKDGARKLFEALGDIGIKPIFFGEVHYCQKCDGYVEQCQHAEDDVIKISGTECRKMLGDKIAPPDWFMRKELSALIIDTMNQEKTVFE